MKSYLVVNRYKRWNKYPAKTTADTIMWDLMMARWYTEIWKGQQKQPLSKGEKKELKQKTGQYFKSKKHLYKFWLKYNVRLQEHLQDSQS